MVNTQEEATAEYPPAKKRHSKRSTQGTTKTGSMSETGDRQAELLARDDIPVIVQMVWDALPWRNSSNAVAPTLDTPISQAVDSSPMQQSSNAR